MFLMNSIKRVIKELPKVDKETDEGWDYSIRRQLRFA